MFVESLSAAKSFFLPLILRIIFTSYCSLDSRGNFETKGQLISEWVYEVIISPKNPNWQKMKVYNKALASLCTLSCALLFCNKVNGHLRLFSRWAIISLIGRHLRLLILEEVRSRWILQDTSRFFKSRQEVWQEFLNTGSD